MILTEEEPKTSDTSGSDICRVKGCGRKSTGEPIPVYLELLKGDEFLFTTYFCEAHIKAFTKVSSLLPSHIKEGKIIGIDPSIIKWDAY